MGEFRKETLEAFVEMTAGSAPAPGGGSVSAYVGALGAALSAMVASLTIGKKGYDGVQERMEALFKEASGLQEELLDAMRKDSTSFEAYMEALRMPKDTEEEKRIRKEKMQEGLKIATRVPVEAAQCMLRIFPLAEEAVKHGNQMAVTDALASAMLARCAVQAGLLNAKTNLTSITDEEFVSEMRQTIRQIEEDALAKERAVLQCSELTA